MGEWTETTLGENVDLLTGYPVRSENYVEDSNAIKLLRGDNVVQGRLRWENVKRWPADEFDGLEDYFLQDGDVVLAMDRPWIEAGTGFLRYLIGSVQFTDHVRGVQTGTAVPHISGKQIRDFKFPRPLIKEQRAIAEILGSLDDKIELNRRMNRALEAMARAIFKAWFVDFEPVKAKAAGATRFPGRGQGATDILPPSAGRRSSGR